MTAILARLPRSQEKSAHDPLSWYARALAEGFGVAAPLPVEKRAFDGFFGIFIVYLKKRLERDTFLMLLADGRASSEHQEHVKEMLALYPKDTLFIGKDQSNEGCAWIEVQEDDLRNDKRFGQIVKAAEEASAAGKRVALAYQGAVKQSTEAFKASVEKMLELNPAFFVTDRPHDVRAVVDAQKVEPWLRVLLRSKPVRSIRARVGHIRFLMRELPLYTVIFLAERMTGRLVSLHTRPLYARDYTAESDTLKAMPNCAIVMQGPLMHRSDFTLETVRMYRRMYPQVRIIITTWEGEDEVALEAAREAGAEVVQSKKPDYGGPGNTNMQLASSYAGIKYARKTGAQYVLKQRTDVRMYNPRAIEFMLNLLAHFPPSERSKQHARLIATGSALYQPYQYGEFLFGAIEDMDDYYSCPLIKKEERFEHYVVEMYVPARFLEKKGWKLEWTIEHGWQVMRECFIVLDWSMLDKVTYKYFQFRYWEYQNQRHYTKSIPSRDAVGFDAWMNIYQGYENKALKPEQKLFFKLLRRTENLG